ncbi:MAG: hypothetical protein JSV08_01330 [Acidobacteriota bacterium]|nr:MAG: hypothetical protein JSV08_01330 [Acidobacteriota bacterium]
MGKKTILVLLATLLGLAGAAQAGILDAIRSPDPSDDVSVLKSLYREHFKPDDVQFGVLLKGSRDGPEHLAVYCYLSKESGRDYNYILGLRRGGDSWQVVFEKLKIDVGGIFVSLPSRPGPPYGKAYGYWKKEPRTKVRLTDVEIVDWVNARVLSASLGIGADEVLARRANGEKISAIAGKTYREKHKGGPSAEKEKSKDTAKGKGRSRGTGTCTAAGPPGKKK